eukprot:TRINITY_DN111392_c0_g1_i1.p1 TRINITY_DN111392_c0_g1~~TRINITY_DN111392_c0_g1_i1.p1  ORF type:complete len:1201 (-),score=245.94 TRINITY_DN111392_c0_g1_i1:190-3708(-)
MEGWLKKKKHHVGAWRWRWCKLEGDVLRYWKPMCKGEEAANMNVIRSWEINLADCYAMPVGETRLLITTKHCRFDEELEAVESKVRDNWLRCLNEAALECRRKSQVASLDTERVLRAVGMWQDLVDSVVSPPCCLLRGQNAGSYTEVVATAEVENTVLAHVRCCRALLRPMDAVAPKPRQGTAVMAGRKVMRRLSNQKAKPPALQSGEAFMSTLTECSLLLLSRRRLDKTAPWPRRQSAPRFDIPDDADIPFAFETLHIFRPSQEDKDPILSFPMESFKLVSLTKEADDGMGFELQFQVCDASQDRTGSWSLIFDTVAACEAWRWAITASRKAIMTQVSVERSTPAEALEQFDADPKAWAERISKRLLEPGMKEKDESLEGELQRLLEACDDVTTEAESLLSGATRVRPLRRDCCEAVATSVFGPVLATMEAFWRRAQGQLNQKEGRRLLQWLDEKRSILSSLSVVFEPLRLQIDSFASDLGLRMGQHLRSMAKQLLVEALRPDGSRQLLERIPALPVDLFTMVHSSVPSESDLDAIEALQKTCQRVAKYVVYSMQDVLWQWLLATQAEVMRELVSGHKGPPQRTASEPQLSQRVTHWMRVVAKLANTSPAFEEHCRQLGTVYIEADQLEMWAEPGMLGGQRFPDEYGLKTERLRFVSFREAALWCLSDAVTLRWRQMLLSDGPAQAWAGPQQARTGLPAGTMPADSLRTMLGGSMRWIGETLESSIYERLLLKVFNICLAAYIIWLSQGLATRGGAVLDRIERRVAQLSQDVLNLCNFFSDLAAAAGLEESQASQYWNVGDVLQLIRSVLQQTHDKSQSQHDPAFQRLSRPDLSTLVRVLSHTALPVMDMLKDPAGSAAPACAAIAAPFQELPPPVPPGGLHGSLARLDVQGDAGADGSVPHGHVKGLRGLFGRRSSRPSLGGPLMARTYSDGMARRPSLPGGDYHSEAAFEKRPRSPFRAVSTEMEGGVCELRVEPEGAYGLYCEVVEEVCPLESNRAGDETLNPSFESDFSSSSSSRKRWVQISRANPNVLPCLEVFSTMPVSGDDCFVASDVSGSLERLSFETLLGVQFRQALELHLAFRQKGSPGSIRRLLLRFDCPSYAFRWRLILQEWWAPEPLPAAERPVIALDCNCRSATLAGNPLTRSVLEQHFGGLWKEVQSSLESAAACR